MNLKGRNFEKLLDFSTDEIKYLIELSEKFKQKKKQGIPHNYLKGKNIVILFEKDSTRTRCAFEVAGSDLGMGVTYIGPTGSQMGKKETIKDTARVLSRMYDGIEYRGFEQKVVEEISANSNVPVWNGLTDEFHPTQMLADFLTIKEHFGGFEGLTLTFIGDLRNNAGNSLMVTCAKLGVNFRGCGPKELWPLESLVETCKKIATDNGSTITLTEDIDEGVKDTNILYADVWVSMGEDESIWQKRIELLQKYQVTKEVMEKANENAIFMHALPSFHNDKTKVAKQVYEKFGIYAFEVTDEVFESKQSVVFDEAENRMHTIKAVMYATMNNKGE